MIKSLKNGGTLQRIAALLLGVAALVYAIYHISGLFEEDIVTVASGVSHEATVVDTKGYVFRDETLLNSSNSGIADYAVSDGAHVSVGDTVAQVYANGATEKKALLKSIDRKIAILEQSTASGYTLADLPEVENEIDDTYYALAKMLAMGDTGGMDKQSDKLLVSMNTYDLLTNADASPVKKTIERLKTERENILKSAGASVAERTSQSGYFYSYADGLEESFTVAAADEITEQGYYDLVSMSAPGVSQNVYGKLSESSEWRFVVRVSAREKGYFKVGQTYELKFTENGNTVIPMTLSSEVDDTRSGGKILVFFANRLPDGFVFNRCQSASIEVSSISGIYVPKSAVHSGEGYSHVYILKGSVVCYRRIEIVYEGKDYYLVSVNAPSESNVEYLTTNELIIVNGSNLFDGRILD